MSRPYYETKSDLNNEIVVMNKLVSNGMIKSYHKLSLAYSLDFAATDSQNNMRLIEIKCRGKFYPEPYVSLLKWKTASSFLAAGVDSSFVWYFKCGRCLIARTSAILEKGDYRFMMTDRTINNRGDKHDCEPVIVATHPREIRI